MFFRIRRGPCSRFLLLFLDIDNKTFFPWFSVFDEYFFYLFVANVRGP